MNSTNFSQIAVCFQDLPKTPNIMHIPRIPNVFMPLSFVNYEEFSIGQFILIFNLSVNCPMFKSSKSRLSIPHMISGSMVFTGITYAATVPYSAVIGVGTLHISDIVYATLIMVSSIIGAFTSVLLGYLSDKIRDRRFIVILSALLGALGHGLIYFVRNQEAFFFATAVLMPFGFALFSQSFSFARAYYNLRQPDRAEFMVSALRTVFSASWVIIPPIAGWVAANHSIFDVYGISAMAYLLSALIFIAMLKNKKGLIGGEGQSNSDQKIEKPANKIELPILSGIIAITVIKTALMMNIIAAPLLIVNKLSGTLADVGIYAGLSAMMEIPFMIFWGYMISKYPKYIIIAFNAVLYAVYLIWLSQISSFNEMLWLQALNAIATAALVSIPISYMQDAIKGRIGLSTSLMDVTVLISKLVSAALFAYFMLAGSYDYILYIAGIISIVGATLLVASHKFLK